MPNKIEQSAQLKSEVGYWTALIHAIFVIATYYLTHTSEGNVPSAVLLIDFLLLYPFFILYYILRSGIATYFLVYVVIGSIQWYWLGYMVEEFVLSLMKRRKLK